MRRFYFSHVLARGPARSLGAAHGFDLLSVFALRGLSFFLPTPSEEALSNAMQGALVRFAGSGDPNGEGLPAWPAYDPAEDTHLVFDDEVRLGTRLREAACNFWSSL